MRILLYNWAPEGAGIKDGGGVSLYLDNLIEGLLDAGCEVSVLSSGYRYSPFTAKPHLVRRRSGRANLTYVDVVNSPVMAPSYFMFGQAHTTVEQPALTALFRRHLQREGPFDIVHLHNLEGISADVLALADEFPQTRFLLTNHNYNLVCQQANLWHRDRERCTTYAEGARCHVCNVFAPDLDALMVGRYLHFHPLNRAPQRVRGLVHRAAFAAVRARRAASRPAAWDLPVERRWKGERIGPADTFRLRRRATLDVVNRHCARVLSVSAATERVLLSYGLDPQISGVSYIGTRHYDPARGRPIRTKTPHLRLAFLGYTRPDKGFQFMVKAMQAMPERMRGRLALKVAARISDPGAVAELERLRGRLAGLTIQNGYTQAELPQLLEDVDLGLVLPLWDDALPQVAIEFVCHGVPILVSDRGGQQELAADPAFVFDAENVGAFWERLQRLCDDREELERFWTLARPLNTNRQHAQAMLELYREVLAEPPRASGRPSQTATALPGLSGDLSSGVAARVATSSTKAASM